jgi:hypothetical protein
MERGESKKIAPIHRGAEIQMEKVKAIRQKALELYKRNIIVAAEKQRQIDAELTKPIEEQDAERLSSLHADIDELKTLEKELDDIIFGSFEQEDALRERWDKLIERMGNS